MSNLERLYYNMHNLTDDLKDDEETIKARDDVENALGEKAYGKYEDVIGSLAAANEKQGFILGFQYAVSLLTGGRPGKETSI